MFKKNSNLKVANLMMLMAGCSAIYFSPASFAQDEFNSAPLPGGAIAMPPLSKPVDLQQNVQPPIIINEPEKENHNPFAAPGSEKMPVSINGLK
jgi:hypothetical protein